MRYLKLSLVITLTTSASLISAPVPLLSEKFQQCTPPSHQIEARLAVEKAPNMAEIDHPISTTNLEAQKSFNKGLTFVFAYNHDLAFREFEKAAQLDPNLAMAYWGMALALGQNINVDVTPENEKRAYGYIQKALSLASNATPIEQAYIRTLATRYTNDPNQDLMALRFIYREAMKKLIHEYPQDLDAACLYAESILCLDPWRYWTRDGKPRDGTLEAIDVLNSILLRNPYHVGGNHFDIHAWEESPTPERALMSAFRLTTLLPLSGHLLHMPCHIFILCGYYEDAINTNQKAINADLQYVRENGMVGEYPLHYLPHNYKISIRAFMLSEQYEKAIQTSNELQEFLKPHFSMMSHIEKSLITPMQVNLYFHRWNELLVLPEPPPGSAFAHTYWHFSRAMAYAQLGNIQAYHQERQLMQQFTLQMKPDQEIANNYATKVFELGELMLDATVAKHNNDSSTYIEYLKKAVAIQDQLDYDEPPAWHVPIRVELGKALLEQKRPEEAEAVFSRGLTQLQRYGRLLFGLQLSLKAQNRDWDAFWVDREARAALRNTSQPLILDNL